MSLSTFCTRSGDESPGQSRAVGWSELQYQPKPHAGAATSLVSAISARGKPTPESVLKWTFASFDSVTGFKNGGSALRPRFRLGQRSAGC